MKSKFTTLMLLLGGITLGSCQNSQSVAEESPNTLAPVTEAIAVITPTEGSQVTGIAEFTQNNDAVDIVVTVEGLEPSTVHGWHIHEFGDISTQDGKGAGGHYNPEGNEHALPETPQRHAGDLGNLTADAEGKATQTLSVNNISISGSKNPILGRGIIIHADEDDGGQPTGNAGGRIGQGVIGVSNPAP